LNPEEQNKEKISNINFSKYNQLAADLTTGLTKLKHLKDSEAYTALLR